MTLHVLLHTAEHALLDTAKLLPILYLSYLLIEALEHHAGAKVQTFVTKAGKAGPLAGAALGLIPQCGFSGGAAGLYCAETISLGTLLAVFLATSDEMLPILISSGAGASFIGKVLLCKFLFALAAGFAADLLYRKKTDSDHIHELCEKEHCTCEGHSIFLAALIHTLKIALTILLVTFLLNIVFELFPVSSLLSGIPVVGELLAALLGLIPNCSSSVILTNLYLNGAISAGAMLSGLFVNGGVGLLVLFRMNGRRKWKNSLAVTGILYGLGVIGGLLGGLFF